MNKIVDLAAPQKERGERLITETVRAPGNPFRERLDLLSLCAWARREIFDAVVAAFAASDRLDESGVNPSVWSVAETYIGAKSTLDLARGIFEIAWRAPVLRMSIAIRLGEVRIGLITPQYGGMSKDLERGFDAYPRGGRGCERILRRLGSSHMLFDYVFLGFRLGDDQLTRQALSGEVHAMSLLADAVFYEAHHLRSGVIHHIHDSGLLLGEVGADAVEVTDINAVPLEIESALTLDEVSARSGVPKDAIFDIGVTRAGFRRFILLVPEFMTQDVFMALALEEERVFKAA